MKNAILLFIICIQCCIAQPKKLSEPEKALETSKLLLDKQQFDSAYVYADKALWLANQSKDKALQVRANLSVAEALFTQGKQVGAIPFAERSLQFAKETNDKEGIMNAWLMLGDIQQLNFQDEKSIVYYRKIDSFAAQHQIENATLVKSIMSTGLLFQRGFKDNSTAPAGRAEASFRRAYQTAIKINSPTHIHIAARHLATTVLERKEPDYKQAISLYTASYNHFKSTGNISELTTTNWAFADLYRRMGKINIAEKFYRENVIINNFPGNITGSAHAHWQYATFLYATRQFKQAVPVYETAIRLFRMQDIPEIVPMAKCLFEVSESFAKIGNMKRAYDYLRVYKTYSDSLEIRRDESDFTQIESKYHSDKKETEMKLVSAQKDIATQKRDKYLFLIFGLLALVVIAIIVVYNNNRNKSRNAEKLLEINEMKSVLFANIGNELRTLLAWAKHPVQSLQTPKDEDQILGFANRLIDLSEIDTSNFNLILKESQLDDFLQSVVAPYEVCAHANGFQFIVNIEKTSGQHYVDKKAIEKIATILLSDTFKNNVQKQTIYFSGTLDNNQLQMRISGGSNLGKEDLPNLFERFYRKNGNQDYSTIGFALVKALVDAYGGTLETALEDNTLRFLVKLPLTGNRFRTATAAESDAIPNIEQTKPESTELPIVLIVEDNSEIRDTIRGLFAREYKILEASDGDQALKLAQKEIPDCIISNITMHNMSGLAFTHAIKTNALTSYVPLILLASEATNSTHLDALKSASDAFFSKPFDHQTLKTTVARLIAEKRKWQQLYAIDWVWKPRQIAMNSADEKFLDGLQGILDSQLAHSDFSADEMAEELGMSRVQLHRKLQTLIGVSATEFLRNERLKAAAELLKKNNSEVTDVAFAVGFDDIPYFSKCFKEHYHLTPQEYAQQA